MADVCQRHVRNVAAPPAGAAPRTMLGDRIALPLAPSDSVLERELASLGWRSLPVIADES